MEQEGKVRSTNTRISKDKLDREEIARSEFYLVYENHFIEPWEHQTEKVRQKYLKKADAFIRDWGRK